MLTDRWIALAASLVILGGLFHGTREAASSFERRTAESGRFQRVGRAFSPTGGGAAVRLPAGVEVDPNTGLMVGLDLKLDDGVIGLPWETLRAYKYEPGLGNLPEEIKRLDGKRVAMLGFLWAIYDYDDIHKFGLVGSHWSCCYGIPPGLSDVVVVELRDGHEGLSQTYNPVRVQGTMHVGERKEGGFTVAIFAMDEASAVVLEY